MRWQDIVIGIGGLWMVVAAFTLTQVSGARWNLVVVGVALMAIAAFRRTLPVPHRWGVVPVALGAWSLVSPWLVGEPTELGSSWTSYGVGLVAILMGTWLMIEPQMEDAVPPRLREAEAES